MPDWKRIQINFKTIKLGQFIEPLKKTIANICDDEYSTVYGVSNTEGITITGKESSKDISKYIILEDKCFAFNPYRINVGSIGMNHKGLKGCVSPAYVVFKTKHNLNPYFLFHYLKSDFGNHLINWYGNKGGVRNALRFADLCKIDIPDIDVDTQVALLNRIDLYKRTFVLLGTEISNQSSYLTQFRQAVLQEAIEGKLTADWRKGNPVLKGDPDYDAGALLEKIKTEKEKLIAAGKIKKQKPLAPIKPEEVPFELPEGWVWTRLGEIFSTITYGTSQSCSYDEKQNSKVLRIPNVSSGDIDATDLKYTNLSSAKLSYLALNTGDILIIRSNGSPEIVGTMVYVSEEYKNYCFAGYLIRLRFISHDIGKYLAIISKSNCIREQIENPLRTTVGINNINTQEISDLLIPVPAIVEQQVIVKRIEKFFSMVTDLEKQVSERKEQAEQLMQAVLREAFEG